jgi:hypothetical protein
MLIHRDPAYIEAAGDVAPLIAQPQGSTDPMTLSRFEQWQRLTPSRAHLGITPIAGGETAPTVADLDGDFPLVGRQMNSNPVR